MVSNGYQFDRDSVKKLKADHETLKRRLHHLEQLIRTGLGSDSKEQQVVVKASELIPAIDSSNCLGTGKAKIYELSQQTSQTQAADGTYYYDYCYEESKREEIRVYNTNKIPISSGQFVLCNRHSKTGVWLTEELDTAIGKAPNGISARSSTTPGSGQVDIFYINDLNVLTYSGYGLTAYNIADAAVATGQHVMIKRNIDGKWYVDMAECS